MSRETPPSEQPATDPDTEERSDVDAALDSLSDVMARLDQSPDDPELLAERDRALLNVGKAGEPLIETGRVSRLVDAVFHEAEQKGEGLHEETHAATTVEDAPLGTGGDAHVEQALGHVNAAWDAAEKKEVQEKEELLHTNELIESSMNWVLIQIDEALKDSPREVEVTKRLSKLLRGMRQQEAQCLEAPEKPTLTFFHKSESAKKQSVYTLRQLNRILSSAAGEVAKIYHDLHSKQEE
ncbi:MAG: hypothetical protein HY340_00210 [Candidatus Kerfeldbacteria bacterium]|nr:hypothetical protein [Candidatus Kerfeldbacteria bacterium]